MCVLLAQSNLKFASCWPRVLAHFVARYVFAIYVRSQRERRSKVALACTARFPIWTPSDRTGGAASAHRAPLILNNACEPRPASALHQKQKQKQKHPDSSLSLSEWVLSSRCWCRVCVRDQIYTAAFGIKNRRGTGPRNLMPSKRELEVRESWALPIDAALPLRLHSLINDGDKHDAHFYWRFHERL